MSITPDVVDLARAGRASTVARTDEQALALAKAWVDAWDALAPEFRDALDRLVDAVDAGDLLPATTLARDRRLGQALARALDVTDQLVADMTATVSADISPVVLAAADTQYQALLAQLPAGSAGTAGLAVLDPSAVEQIVARTTERIHAATLPLPEDVVARMRQALVTGVVVGDNPRRVAARLVDQVEGRFAGGLARAERIARTEMLDAHRRADQAMSEKNRSLIAAQVWCATLDSKTCGSCLGMHGSEWPAAEFGPADHPQGRCIFLPRTKSWAELGFTGIEDQGMDLAAERDAWWDNLTTHSQDRILGAARAQYLRDGGTWSALSTRRENPDWRPSYGLTPLRDLPGLP